MKESNMQAKLNSNEVALFLNIRNLTDPASKKAMRKQVFAAIKARLGIPANHALKVDLDNFHSSAHQVILRKKGNAPYELHMDGKWVGWTGRPVPTTAEVQPGSGAVTADTVYPYYVRGETPRRFFQIENNGVQDVIDSNTFDEGADVLHGVVTDKQVDYQDGKGLRRTIILANNTMYAEFKANEL